MKNVKTILSILTVILFVSNAQARDQIRIVGSSTVYPYATVVAENFGKTGKFKTPVIESTGTGGGMKLFCAGVGTDHPDITNASRAIKSKEKALCEKNGVTEIIEIIKARIPKTLPFLAILFNIKSPFYLSILYIRLPF